MDEVRLLHDLQEKRLTSNRDVDEEEKEEKVLLLSKSYLLASN